MTLESYTQWTCHDCGVKHGKWYENGNYTGPAEHYATYHVGTCDICHKKPIPVTELRDYGGFRGPSKRKVKPEALDDLIGYVIDDFPFVKVHSAMTAVGWKWTNKDDTLSIPSIERMQECATKLLNDVIKHRESDYLAIGTGGFMAEADDEGLSLRFVFAETESLFSDFDD